MNRTFKNTNIFSKRFKSFTKNAILRTIDVIGIYANMPHEEGLVSVRKHLSNRENKEVTIKTLVELADIIMNDNSSSS